MRLLLFCCLLFSFACNPSSPKQQTMPPKPPVDWQGHRGARGLLPENTTPAFLKALEYSAVLTLELDVVVSKDQQIIISHEPWFSEKICTKPDGQEVTEEEAKSLKIYEMTYAEIQRYDCGSRGNVRFLDQQKMAVYKPAFKEMVLAVEARAQELNRPLPFYNIELKSQPDYYNLFTPEPALFVQLLIAELKELHLTQRVTLQSFDLNILETIHQQNDQIVTALLVENQDSFEKNVALLSFKPTKYSPYFETVTRQMVESVHERGLLLVPWTINEVSDMRRMLFLGVDGIITDYPNRIEEALKKTDDGKGQ